MILKIETEILGNFSIEKDMKIKHNPFEIDIRFEEEMNRFFISISRRVTDYSSYLPIMSTTDHKISQINFPPQSFLEEQIEILQYIESFGAIDKGVEKINWQNCSIEWIPETDIEEEELTIKKYNRDLSYDKELKILSRNWLFNTIIYRRQLSHLTLPFSFFREGANFYHNFQYQNSFINFYLMLEGFFGNGIDYKNEKMKLEFKKSDILEYAINESIQYLENMRGKHYEWLIEICKRYNKKVDKEGIIHVIVEQRGNLSHFSFRNLNKQKNPFKDSSYESLAFITMSICVFSSIKLRLGPFR